MARLASILRLKKSHDQIVRNLRSVGLNLTPWIEAGRLHIFSERPSAHGLEMHLAKIYRTIRQVNPTVVVMDPISNFLGGREDVLGMMTRLVDYLKSKQITGFFTHLNQKDKGVETTELGISSVMDTWILLRDIESSGERNRGIYVLKSRGMAHSNQIREFILSSHGIDLVDVYRDPDGSVLTGSARLARLAQDADKDGKGLEDRNL